MKNKGFTIHCSHAYGQTKPDTIEAMTSEGYDPRMYRLSCGQCFCYMVMTEAQLKRLTNSIAALADRN